jgi:hypothetical protein
VSTLIQSFDERVQEIDSYLNLLDALEKQTQNGPPRIGAFSITTQQQKILYAAVYLHLYNLVEATLTWCLDAVSNASRTGGWLPSDLSNELRREWVRTQARTHMTLSPETRLQTTIEFCECLVQLMPIGQWGIERRNAGSWDDKLIEDMTSRLGCSVRLKSVTLSGIKRKIRDDKSTLELVKNFRNMLAHGSISFTECGTGVTSSELRTITANAINYLREVVQSFENFISSFEFLDPARRPAAGGVT